jgi:nitronate monooxygenase
MALPDVLKCVPFPVIASPLFIISNPQAGDRAVSGRCRGQSMPALNARPASQLDDWLAEITETLAAWDRAHPEQPAAPVCHQPDRAQEQ